MIIKPLIRNIPSKDNHNSIIDQRIPKEKGIYFLYDNNMELVYIGRSNNIRARLVIHLSLTGSENNSPIIPRSYKERICFYSVILNEDDNNLFLLESVLIAALKPKFNLKDKPFED